ncbi:hypothetical protein BaRGS_00021754 [Batillaria attramentaria]|uniref:Uncharacterized protein n=1 Tax=Batillaria attramentaria TaxID=370345 RepID=A0ABD0KIR8_9CAEN
MHFISGCNKCGEIGLRNTLSAAAIVSLEHDAEEINQKKLKDDCLVSNTPQEETLKEKFRKSVSTLLNTPGGGVVIIHAHNVRFIDHFNSAIQDKVKQLIPDGSSYSDNFQCSVFDAEHISFAVKPRKGRLGVSTVESYIKSSADAGLCTPTQTEMIARVKKLSEEPPASRPPNVTASVKLIKGEEVFIDGTPFCESSSRQAKDVKRKELTEGKEFPQHNYWDQHKVRDCISGMSGVDTGGHLFLGVHEEKKKGKKRCRPNNDLLGSWIHTHEGREAHRDW